MQSAQKRNRMRSTPRRPRASTAGGPSKSSSRTLYELLEVPTPYKKQPAALTNSAEFKAITGNGINRKLNLIRKAGNSAVHGSRTVRPDVALAVLRETAPCGGV